MHVSSLIEGFKIPNWAKATPISVRIEYPREKEYNAVSMLPYFLVGLNLFSKESVAHPFMIIMRKLSRIRHICVYPELVNSASIRVDSVWCEERGFGKSHIHLALFAEVPLC